MDIKELGLLGENIAGRFLEGRGYVILDRNYKRLSGEIDLIAEKDGIIAFVEVKTNGKDYASGFNPEVRVDRQKISHISKVANIYLSQHGWLGSKEWQIDICSVILKEGDRSAKVQHFKNVASAIF